MVVRQIERFEKNNLGDTINKLALGIYHENEGQTLYYEQKYLQTLADEAIHQYQDYFESDSEDLAFIPHLTEYDRLSFAKIFENYASPQIDVKGSATFPKRQWNSGLGVWQNFLLDIQEYSTKIIPKATLLANQAEIAKINVAGKKELLESGQYAHVTGDERTKLNP